MDGWNITSVFLPTLTLKCSIWFSELILCERYYFIKFKALVLIWRVKHRRRTYFLAAPYHVCQFILFVFCHLLNFYVSFAEGKSSQASTGSLFSILPNRQRFSSQIMTEFLFLPPSLISATLHLSSVPHFSGCHILGYPRHLISGSHLFFSFSIKKRSKLSNLFNK